MSPATLPSASARCMRRSSSVATSAARTIAPRRSAGTSEDRRTHGRRGCGAGREQDAPGPILARDRPPRKPHRQCPRAIPPLLEPSDRTTRPGMLEGRAEDPVAAGCRPRVARGFAGDRDRDQPIVVDAPDGHVVQTGTFADRPGRAAHEGFRVDGSSGDRRRELAEPGDDVERPGHRPAPWPAGRRCSPTWLLPRPPERGPSEFRSRSGPATAAGATVAAVRRRGFIRPRAPTPRRQGTGGGRSGDSVDRHAG